MFLRHVFEKSLFKNVYISGLRSDARRSEENIGLTDIEVDSPSENTERKTVVGGDTLCGGDMPTPGTSETSGAYVTFILILVKKDLPT